MFFSPESYAVSMMKSGLDHLPEHKQRELARIIDILHEEFQDAIADGTADFKKRGRILKVILFGSYARGGWIDEPHTMKGYRSDFDLLIVVNNRKLTDFASYWSRARDRLLRTRGVTTPVSFIVYSRREVNTFLKEGQYFFSDIRRDGVVLYELDDEPLAEAKPLTAADAYRLAKEHFETRFPEAVVFLRTARFQLGESGGKERAWLNSGAFSLHQSIEQAYACLLLTLTNYSPPSHNLSFLRSLAEEQDRGLAEAWPRDRRRYVSQFNTLNEAYVKARYSKHYEISEEALVWVGERTAVLHGFVEQACQKRLAALEKCADG